MESILRLAVPVVERLALAGAAATPMNLVIAASCIALAALTAIAAGGCLTAALWLAVLPHLGPALAAVVCAAALAASGGILVAIAVGVERRPKPASPPALADLLRHVDGEVLLRDHKSDLLVAALVAGLVAGGYTHRPLGPEKRLARSARS